MTTTTTTAPATATTSTSNPHRAAVLILGWAIPVVLLGAVWGAVQNPGRAGISAAAFLLLLALYGVKKVQFGAWNLRRGVR